MTQDQIHEAEKQNGIIRWVFIGIEKIPHRPDGSHDYYSRERLFHYDLPRELYDRRKWVIQWRVAKLQCQYPKDQITPYYAFYDKKTNLPIHKGVLDKKISAKRMITTIANKMAEAKKHYVPTLYDPTIETTQPWIKAARKLQAYHEKLLFYTAEVERIVHLPASEKPVEEMIDRPHSIPDSFNPQPNRA